MQSLAEILHDMKERADERAALAGYVPVEEPADPRCPKCHGSGILSAGFDKSSKVWIAKTVSCDCYVRPVPVGPTFEGFRLHPKYPDLEDAYNAALLWAAHLGPGILVLGGERGVGKTHLARAAFKTCIAQGDICHWVKDGDLIDGMFLAFERHNVDEWMASVCKIPVLFIDDLGLSPLTTEAIRSLYDRIIDSRWEGAQSGTLRTMVTTNLAPRDFPPRMRSRLLDARLSKAVVIDAPDHRQISVGEE